MSMLNDPWFMQITLFLFHPQKLSRAKFPAVSGGCCQDGRRRDGLLRADLHREASDVR